METKKSLQDTVSHAIVLRLPMRDGNEDPYNYEANETLFLDYL